MSVRQSDPSPSHPFAPFSQTSLSLVRLVLRRNQAGAFNLAKTVRRPGASLSRFQGTSGFHTFRNPCPSKSFTFTVANSVTPCDVMVSADRAS